MWAYVRSTTRPVVKVASIATTVHAFTRSYRASETRQSSSSHAKKLRAASAAAAAAVVAVTWGVVVAAEVYDPHRGRLPMGLRQRVVTNYENRIRAWSSPEKVFQTFASVEKEDEVFMTAHDFMRSLFPSYGLHDTTPELQDAEKSLVSLVDTDQNGLISFAEYVFFLTLLAIPIQEFHVAFQMFDLDMSGAIDRDEFKNMMHVMQRRFPMGRQQRTNAGEVGTHTLLGTFFGDDDRLSFDEFSRFVRDLQLQILRLEFLRFDCANTGSITAAQFAQAIVTNTAPRKREDLAQRVECVAEAYPDGRISFFEYQSFHEMLKKLDAIDLAVQTYSSSSGSITRADLIRASKAVAGVELSPLQVDVIFMVFDKDGDGFLQPHEFVEVLRQKVEMGLGRHRDVGVCRFLSCCRRCSAEAWRGV